jgi:flap endonuclease-1
VPTNTVSLNDLKGKSIAIDAYNTLYQFLAIIRQPDGTPLKDRTGRVTSHLSGLLYRTSNLIEKGINVVYVFDGKPPALKEMEIKRRMKAKKEALIKYEKALKKGDLEEARTYAQATSKLKDYMTKDSKKLLTLLGIPWVQAPSEGEAQAAYIYIQVLPQIVELDNVLKKLNISYEQLVDIGILVGTDFNPDGVKGVGPKTAHKLIKKYGELEKLMPTLKDAKFPVDPQQIRKIFLYPKVTNNYQIEWRKPDIEEIVDFLCRQRDFSEERVRKALKKMSESPEDIQGKNVTLESWF